MSKKTNLLLLTALIFFSIYCALTVGETWDQKDNLIRGKITLDYLFSLGRIESDILYRENYSTIYWSLIYFVSEIFPAQYEIQITNLVNLTFSISTIFGIKKLCKELFNNKIGKITFLILFFTPLFFGHMFFNTKDTILAFSHVWIFYFLIRYLKKQNVNAKRNRYTLYLGILAALSTGIQLVFLGSLIPIILFFIIEILFIKKIINENFSVKKLIYDVIKSFLFFYILLIIFWIDVHPNIFILPYEIISKTFSADFWTGWPYNLVNGKYYLASEVPKSYIFLNLFFKSPEYVLILYVLFFLFFFNTKEFFRKKIIFFNYKMLLIFFILLFPNIVLFIIPYPIYDGMRLFLWSLPYFCIIPGITLYYLFENFNLVSTKIYLSIIAFSGIFFLYNFFAMTPYQYTYLNSLNGKASNGFNKFENDYWGSSIKELVNKSYFNKEEIIKISTCGTNYAIVKKYFKKEGYTKIEFVHPEKSNYILMTNRSFFDKKTELVSNCFNVFKGKDIFKVQRNGLVLSAIREIN